MPYYQNTDTPKLSYSLLDGWGTCQLRTFFDRCGPRPPPTEAMIRGTAAHKAMEEIARRVKSGMSPQEACAAESRQSYSQPTRTSWIHHVRPMFEGLQIKNIERWFGEDTNPWGLRGRIDLETLNTPVFDSRGVPTGEVRDGPCVLDYKTISQARYCKKPWEVAKSLQAAIYSIVTGVRRFVYVYLLPNGEVRATIAEIPEASIVQHANWLGPAIRSLESSWALMRELLEAGEDPAEAFAPAPAGHPFCSPKCSQAGRCGVFPK